MDIVEWMGRILKCMLTVKSLMFLQHPAVFSDIDIILPAAYGFSMYKAYITSYAIDVSCIYKVVTKGHIVVAHFHALIESPCLLEHFLPHGKACGGHSVNICRKARLPAVRVLQ